MTAVQISILSLPHNCASAKLPIECAPNFLRLTAAELILKAFAVHVLPNN